jgi:predicted ATPase
MSNLPIISIEPKKVTFNLPWVDKKTIDKVLIDFKLTKLQRTEELKRAKKAWDIDNYKTV